MAEAIVNHELKAQFEAFSAGLSPTQPHPLALRVLSEIGIDHSGATSKHLDKFAEEKFDYVISLCDDADKTCPTFFGGTNRVHISFENPDAATGTESERMDVFRRVRDDLRKRIIDYLISNE